MTDTELKVTGLKLLNDNLGLVETERFITLFLRDKFDYTEWRSALWQGKTLEDIWSMAGEKQGE